MKRFAALYDAIDGTTSTNAKVAAMVKYFAEAPAADAAWAIFFLTGRRLKRLVPSAAIRDWTLAATGLDAWLLEESYAVVGDGAETAALVLDQVAVDTDEDIALAEWVEGRILPLRELDPATQQIRVSAWWGTLNRLQRFMLLKILTGELRVGVSQTLVVRALAEAAALPATTIAARMMGDWTPTAGWLASLLSHEHTDVDRSRPYPFFLASPLEGPVESLGARERLARRVEVGRHSRAAGAPSGGSPPLVAGRRAHHAAVPGDCGRRHSPPGWHRPRRRSAGVPRRPPAALRRAAAAHRPPETGRADGPGGTSRLHGLRPARRRWRRRARPPARRAPRRALRHIVAAGRPAHSLNSSRQPRGRNWRTLVAIARAWRRRVDAQTAVVPLRGRPAARRLVEMEDRSVHD